MSRGSENKKWKSSHMENGSYQLTSADRSAKHGQIGWHFAFCLGKDFLSKSILAGCARGHNDALFWPPTYPRGHFLCTKRGQKWQLLDLLPTPSCPRGCWMPPKLNSICFYVWYKIWQWFLLWTRAWLTTFFLIIWNNTISHHGFFCAYGWIIFTYFI